MLAALVLAASGCSGQGRGTAPTCEDHGGRDAVCGYAPAALRLTVDGGLLRDGAEREVLLRGANAGGRSKFSPFFPFPFSESGRPEQADAPPFEEAAAGYADMLAGWGLNVVRMPMSWEALEPERGSYDMVYLGRYRRLAEIMGERDIRVIVDFHQDVFAWPYCGDGFPIWACPDPVPERPEDCSGWFMGYFDDVVMKAAFDRFWANGDGLRDDFEAMWRLVAGEMWQVDAVIGFEIINEPHHGTAEEDVWAVDVLTPFYGEIAAAIREEAPGAPVFFDSTGTDAVNTTTSVERPGGGDFVFAPHFYHAAAFMAMVIPSPRPSDEEVATYLERWALKRQEWDLPVIVGEYGIHPEAEWAWDYVRSNYDAFDLHLLHATIWECSTTQDDWNAEGMSITGPGGSETVVVDAAVRPYPAAVAGRILAFGYDAATREGELVWEAVAGGISEVAVPARVYPEGVDARLDGVDGCVEECGGSLHVLAAGDGTATLTFRPAG